MMLLIVLAVCRQIACVPLGGGRLDQLGTDVVMISGRRVAVHFQGIMRMTGLPLHAFGVNHLTRV